MKTNQNLLFIAVVILGLLSVTIFFYLIFLKIKLMGVRKQLQQTGLIKNSFKIHFLLFFELVFWMLPVFIKYSVDHTGYRGLINRINLLWLIMIISAFCVLKVS